MTLAKLGGVFIVATLVSAWLSLVGIKQHLDLPVAQAQPGGGFMYVLPLPNLSSISDVNEAPTRSRLTLFEDNRELGPPHSLHTEIAGGGSGRFSHYRDHLYFSARDNSDVRTNGHTYYAVRAWKLPRVVPLALGTLTAALFLVLGWRVGFRELPRLARERMRDAVRRVVQARATLLRLAAFASIFAALLTIVLAWSGVATRVQLDNARAEFASGHMYAYEMARLESAADTNDDPFRSSLVVYEDGRRLGPPHTMHSEIVSAGAGRFSHYSQYLYFSASDNSDVTKNGRSYSISYPSRLNPAYAAVSVLFAALFVVLLARMELGIAFGSMRPHHIVEAFRRAGGVYLLISAGLIIAVRFGLLLYAAPDMAAEELDLLRRGLRRIVSLLLGVGGGAALYFQARSPRPRRLAEAVAGFIFLLVLGSALSTRPLIFAACVAFGVGVAHLAFAFRDRRLPSWFGEMGREWLGAQGLQQRQWVWRVCAGAVTLTLINVVPEVVLYWDQSGWMDSRFYDVMAHDIARGVAPFGNSEYAPVYQYAMAALYWSLGHFFFVQQVGNVVLACATAVCMCWAAWFFFRNLVAVACMGLFVAYWDAVHHAVWYTQIENIYVPLFAASILALAFYLSSRSRRAVALMAVSAAVVFCTRQQSAFYVMALPLAVLLVDGLSLKERGRQLLTYGMVFFLLGVLPWSLRNWHQEDRFSPSSRQSTTFLAVLNDPRIPFHAIRYWERSAEVRAEWVQRYPNEKERNRAMQAYFRERLFNDTNYFVSAAPWRLAAFYGLLPGVYLANDWTANKPIDFLANWGPQLRARYDLWVPVALSLIALAWRWRSSTAWLLFALIGANVLVGLLVGSAEPRTCYPRPAAALHPRLCTAPPLRSRFLCCHCSPLVPPLPRLPPPRFHRPPADTQNAARGSI